MPCNDRSGGRNAAKQTTSWRVLRKQLTRFALQIYNVAHNGISFSFLF
ncbi:hypothetical protein [Helicobacter sp.]|nr:hypothetical protein [Helicobacter sp.]MCI5633712.1 hypothetical protein [Helicobacter sp.]